MIRLFTLASFGACCVAHAEVEYSINADWASKYVEQGFETTEDSFYSVALEAAVHDWSFGFLAGYAPEQDYKETNLSLTYAHELGQDLEVTFGYSRYDYQEDESYANELDLVFYYTPLDELETYLHLSYSFEAERVYMESGVSYTLEMSNDFSITPYALIGFDFGYLTPEYDGGNHVQIGLEAAYAMNSTTSLYLAAHNSIPLENVEREGQDALFWVNAGVTYEF